MPGSKKLSTMQLDFVRFYTGNATEAAIKAGYSRKTAYSQGQRLLKKVEIAELIQKRQENSPKRNRIIATRQERQEFWTKTMKDEGCSIADRLRASELLGKSEADFITKHEVTGKDGGPVQVEELTGKTPEELALIAAQEREKA